ncbi:hypothetical protein ACTMS0_16640 [Micromonospora sp. H33]|uniref:hypothetical protein n=1 Tax=Micromonospora sp. H33 TaxID=3452215 RepID=UPI003F8862F9
MTPRKIVVSCDRCFRTQTMRPGRVESCDGYFCVTGHGPSGGPPPGLVRELVINAAGGFWGWRDVLPSHEAMSGILRAREILAIGQAQRIIEDAGDGSA